jgi:hypothetical protein
MNRVNSRQLITILATLLTITVNGLANALPINGQSTGEISDRFAISFVPAGYVFSIWGIIYLGLVAFTIYQALPARKDNELLKKIAPAYWIGSLANIAWILLWHYEFFPLTLLAMIIILATLIFIYRQMSKVKSSLEGSLNWFVRLPFSIYLGWISVATIANVSQVLFSSGWSGWGISGATWAVIMIAIATILGLLMIWREQEIPYSLVLVWASVGIAQKQSASSIVATAAWITAGLLVLAVLAIPLLKGGMRVRS